VRAVDVGETPVAILAGGLATRLGSVAQRVPKAMLEVAGRPFIAHQLAGLREAGIRRVVLCVGYLGEQVEAYVGDGAAHGLVVRYSYDGPTLLGTAGALRRAEPLLGDVFWVLYGDAYLEVDYRAVLAELERRGGLGIMLVLRNANRWDRSNVVFRDGRLVRYDKARPTPDMTHIDYGVAVLRKAALARIPADRPGDLADVYRDMADEGLLTGYEVTRRFYEIGSPAGLAEAQRYLESRAAASGPPSPRWVGEGAGG
jgi:NDP-sugar pyrophosphorylase family protein